MPRFRVQLDRVPEAPGLARRAVSEWLTSSVDPPLLEDCRLLVSELVTNAVLHQRAAGGIEMELALAGRRLRVQVSDPGPGFARPRIGPPPANALGGRGLLIVDRLASRWGVTPGRPTRVWFELDG